MNFNKKVCLKFMKIQYLKIKIHLLGIYNKLAQKLNNKIILIKLFLHIYIKTDKYNFKVKTFKMKTSYKYQKGVL